MASLDPSVHDTLFLWYLARPDTPRLVGRLERATRPPGVSLAYAPRWLAEGFALSEDLPLHPGVFLPHEKDTAPGAVDDARPDRWGERVIRVMLRPPRLSMLEMLFHAGDHRFGALGVSTSEEDYRPFGQGPLPHFEQLDALHDTVRRILAGEPVDDAHRRLFAPGASMGGARPKALVEMDGAQWIVKFAERGHETEPLREHATMTLARLAGIRTAGTRLVAHRHGHAVAIRRFDRQGDRRLHAMSARVALLAAGEPLSYPALAQVLRRRGRVAGDAYKADMRELFRRMVFNILVDNTDDHEKNHVLLLDDDGTLALSPAFDVLPTGQALGYQQMEVGERGAESTIDNALSRCRDFGLTRPQAVAECQGVARAVDGWRAHFLGHGVPPADVDLLADQVDRPFLREQRRA